MYKPIPEGATKVYLDSFSCDTNCCGAIYFYISASIPSNRPFMRNITLWKSTSFFYVDDTAEELEELRQSVKHACEHYGIEPVDIEDSCVFDWEGERIL
jgi:hypothetical protein